MSKVVNLKRTVAETEAEWVMTPTAGLIHDVLRQCEDEGDMGLVVGAPGTGKTTALERYVGERTMAWLCTLSPAYSALKPGLARLCETLCELPSQAGAYALRCTIIHQLRYKLCPAAGFGSCGVILIDEAQHASDQFLEEIRCIHDETRIGVVLCGNATFPARFGGKVGLATFAQLTSRIGARVLLSGPTQEDVTAICEHYGIPQGREQAFLQRTSGQGGGLRTVVRIIRLAGKLAGDDGAIGIDRLSVAAEMLGMPS